MIINFFAFFIFIKVGLENQPLYKYKINISSKVQIRSISAWLIVLYKNHKIIDLFIREINRLKPTGLNSGLTIFIYV